jgi:phage virion morphogenesis protein
MAGAALVFDVRGLPAVAKIGDRLEKYAREAAGDVLDVVGAVVESQTRRRLSEEKTSPDGTPWAPLSEDYEDWKKERSSGGILEFEGFLIASITQENNGKRVRVGSNLAYAATHQFGDSRTVNVRAHTRLIKEAFGKPLKFGVYQSVGPRKLKRNIPARPYLGIGSGDEGISAALNDYFEALAQKHLNGEIR